MLVATCIGKLARDPEMQFTQNGKAFCKFSLPHNRKRNNVQLPTIWVNVTIWGAKAELAATMLHKGMGVYVHGELEQRTYTDRQGQTRTSLDLSTSDFTVTDWGDRQAQGGDELAEFARQKGAVVSEPYGNDDGAPF